MIDKCPACHGSSYVGIVTISDAPVFCNVLFETREEALNAAVGTIDLVCCEACGLLYNRAFDAASVDYSPAYENSLHHSPTFRLFVDGLARRLIEAYGIENSEVVEIGSGGGLFLRLLCELGNNRGTGYDPSHDADRYDVADPRLRVVAGPYPSVLEHQAKLVLSQHVLEHLTDPRSLVETIHQSLQGNSDAVVYHEVPNATYMIENTAIWDLIYEHVSYFTQRSLIALHEACGFRVLDSRVDFGGQFLSVEAAIGDVECGPVDAGTSLRQATAFGVAAAERIDEWGERLAQVSAGGPTVIWGAGSKGVQFLNVVKGASAIAAAVDLNPHKRGRYVPVTGHRVVAPEDLVELEPAQVIAMNPIYLDEIRSEVARLGLSSEVLSM